MSAGTYATRSLGWLLLVFCASALVAQTETAFVPRPRPFEVQSHHPFRLGLLDPRPQTAELPPQGHLHFSASLDYGSVFLLDASDQAQRGASDPTLRPYLVHLDGEFARFAPVVEYGLSDTMAVSVEAAIFHTSGGVLDSFLSNYHDFFGLPNAGRELVAPDEFRQEIRDRTGDNGRVVWRAEPGLHLGNLTFWFRHGLSRIRHAAPHFCAFDLGWRAGVKLPVGSTAGGMNSGHADLALGTLLSLRYDWLGMDLNADAVVPLGYDFNQYAAQQDYASRSYFKAMASFQLALSQRLYLVNQFALNSSVIKAPSGLDALDAPVMLGSFGGQVLLNTMEFHFSISEDLFAKGEADFWLTFTLRGSF